MDKENVADTHNEILLSHKNEILSFGTWLELEVIMFIEVNQAQKDKNCLI
jgi:hypothetical protein